MERGERGMRQLTHPGSTLKPRQRHTRSLSERPEREDGRDRGKERTWTERQITDRRNQRGGLVEEGDRENGLCPIWSGT